MVMLDGWSERSGSKPTGNSLGNSGSEPSASRTAGGAMATEERARLNDGSILSARKKLTSSGWGIKWGSGETR